MAVCATASAAVLMEKEELCESVTAISIPAFEASAFCQNDDEDDEEEDGDDAEELLGKGARGAALLADRTRVSVDGVQFNTCRCVWVRLLCLKIWKLS